MISKNHLINILKNYEKSFMITYICIDKLVLNNNYLELINFLKNKKKDYSQSHILKSLEIYSINKSNKEIKEIKYKYIYYIKKFTNIEKKIYFENNNENTLRVKYLTLRIKQSKKNFKIFINKKKIQMLINKIYPIEFIINKNKIKKELYKHNDLKINLEDSYEWKILIIKLKNLLNLYLDIKNLSLYY